MRVISRPKIQEISSVMQSKIWEEGSGIRGQLRESEIDIKMFEYLLRSITGKGLYTEYLEIRSPVGV